ncbi:hypothetical protein EVC45_12460 [Paraburkholderia sp. UYCP14C]|uniref:hypothetical protein n=1 Tax=Paraburkholderia sp. UYCP14C TaxID=2511130 RepID=UPI00102229E2|nr:hypothetical protein [Paraburkholderia sp. UYCP14C]RZF29271.1 hypothetical protein EVC45_12460 [Paraburkholderia sp. UYCP14C]
MATDPDNIDLRHSATDSRSPGFEPDGPDESGAPPPRFGRLALCLAAAGALTFGVMGTVAYGVWFNQDQQTYADAIAGARLALGSSAAGGVPTVAVAHASEEVAAPSGTQFAAQLATQPATQLAVQPATQSATPQLAAQPAEPSAAQPTAPDVAHDEVARVNAGVEDSNPSVWSGQIHPATPDPSLTATLADPPVDTTTDKPADASADTSLDKPTAAIASTPPPRPTRHAANSTAKPPAGHGAKDARLAQQDRRASSEHKGGLFARIGQFLRRVSYRQHDNGRQQQNNYSHP